jgi:hypothetical protein
MVERTQDAEDRLLSSMFQSAPIIDDGFSRRVMARIRRQIWVRRLALPVAIILGVAIAAKPAAQLVTIGSQVFGSLATELVLPHTALASQMPVFIVVGLGLAFAVLTFRLFEE